MRTRPLRRAPSSRGSSPATVSSRSSAVAPAPTSSERVGVSGDRLRRLARARARPAGRPLAAADRRLRVGCRVARRRDRAEGSLGHVPLPQRDDERAAVLELEALAELARDDGLVARFGRKVLEVLPPVGSNKGTAVRNLLEARRPVARTRRGRRHHRSRRVPRGGRVRAQAARRRPLRESPTILAEHAELVLVEHGRVPRAPAAAVVHVGEAVLAPLRVRFGDPAVLPWEGEISDREWAIATHNPTRTHDVTLFILDPSQRIALIRKPHFAEDVWRPPGGGIKPDEDFVAGAVREAREETGLHVELRRYLVASEAVFRTAAASSRGGRTSSSPRPRTRSSPRTIRRRSPTRAGARSPSWAARFASDCSRPGVLSGATASPCTTRRSRGSSSGARRTIF